MNRIEELKGRHGVETLRELFVIRENMLKDEYGDLSADEFVIIHAILTSDILERLKILESEIKQQNGL